MRALLTSCLLIFALPALASCSKLQTQKALRGVDPAIELLLDSPDDEFVRSYVHPDGGFLLCRDGVRTLGSVARLDEDGNEVWRTLVQGTDGVDLLHVDDAGQIYVYTRARELDVLDSAGNTLWKRPRLYGVMDSSNIGDGDSSIMLLTGEEIQFVGRDGELRAAVPMNYDYMYSPQAYFSRMQDGRVQVLMGWHYTENGEDGACCGLAYRMIDDRGNVLWEYEEGGLDGEQPPWAQEYEQHVPGKLRILPDDRVLVWRDEVLLEFSEDGVPSQLPMPEDGAGFLFGMADDPAGVTDDGNYIFCQQNIRLTSGGMNMTEVGPGGELVHRMYYSQATLEGEPDDPHGPVPQRQGLGYFDIPGKLAYLYFEREPAARSGGVHVLDQEGNELQYWDTGLEQVRKFMSRDDGRIIARVGAGDLLLLPEFPVSGT